ncbi:hypothetical protein NitYY0826_C0210 [Nitratiruptor sp. YY08-26]|nr:hypothetical protein NitYY0826_C0210 [Nitratiruptor sp. YY08-26]
MYRAYEVLKLQLPALRSVFYSSVYHANEVLKTIRKYALPFVAIDKMFS